MVSNKMPSCNSNNFVERHGIIWIRYEFQTKILCYIRGIIKSSIILNTCSINLLSSNILLIIKQSLLKSPIKGICTHVNRCFNFDNHYVCHERNQMDHWNGHFKWSCAKRIIDVRYDLRTTPIIVSMCFLIEIWSILTPWKSNFSSAQDKSSLTHLPNLNSSNIDTAWLISLFAFTTTMKCSDIIGRSM